MIRELRNAAGLTQRQLAERAGVSVGVVRDIEQGRVLMPRPATTQRLVRALGMPRGRQAAWHAAVAARGAPVSAAAGAGAEVRILGPLQVWVAGVPVRLGTGLERLLLALLALHIGRPVSRDAIVDTLWGDRPPPTAAARLASHVARLRQRLRRAGVPAAPDMLVHEPAGYRLDLAPDRLDAERFQYLINRAGSVDGEAARELLRQALSLWRGQVLADLPALRDAPAVVALERLRAGAVTRYAALSVETGCGEQALPILLELAAVEPLHEPLHAWIITVEAACGEQARALRTYDAIRRRLRDELGVSPGEELRAAHQRVLLHQPMADATRAGAPADAGTVGPTETGDRAAVAEGGSASRPPTSARYPDLDTGDNGPDRLPGRWATPAQLPAAPTAFIGRQDAIERLNRLLPDQPADPEVGAPSLAVLTGVGGIGKTALAVHWAHRVRHLFPDGQFYVNLRGHSTLPAVTAAQALGRFLRAMGVPPGEVPEDPDEAAALFRSLVQDRRILMILDDAADCGQVRALLPGTAAGRVVVTSRYRLAGLVGTHGAQLTPLRALRADEATSLLTSVFAGQQRQVDARALPILIRACCGHPLALRVAAANVAASAGGMPTAYLREVQRCPLGALRIDDDLDTDVRSVLHASYRLRSDLERRLFRLLSLTPGHDLHLHAIAALAGVPPERVRAGLANLVGAHLLEEHARFRYRQHDLLRRYALDCAQREETGAERLAALRRLSDWYLAIAAAANQVLSPYHAAVPGPPAPAELPFRPEQRSVVEFLTAEGENLPAIARAAAGCGRHQMMWQFTYLLAGFFDLGSEPPGAIETARHGLAAAEYLDDPTAQRIMHSTLSAFYAQARTPAPALHHARHAFRLADPTTNAAANAKHAMARALAQLGRSTEALTAYHEALELFRRNGNRHGEAMALNNLGNQHRRRGELDLARRYVTRALRLWQELGDVAGQAQSRHTLGGVFLKQGLHPAARAEFAAALATSRRVGLAEIEVSALRDLGRTALAVGDPDGALAYQSQALALCRRIGDGRREAVVLRRIAEVHLALGNVAEARARLDQAIAMRAVLRSPFDEAELCELIATVRERSGDRVAAVADLRRAITLYESVGAVAQASAARARLPEANE